MRVAIFHPGFNNVGGAEVLVAEQARIFREHGHEVTFFTFSVLGAFWTGFFRDWSIHVIPKREGWEHLFACTRSSKIRSRGRRAEPLFEGYDRILATNHPCSTMLGRMSLSGTKLWYCNEAPRMLFPRETSPYGTAALARLGPSTPALKVLQRQISGFAGMFDLHGRLRRDTLEAARGLHHTLFNSRFTLDNARAAFKSLSGEVVYPIIEFPPPGPVRPSLDRQALRILVQTRLSPLKNVETLIRGFHLFHGEHPGAELHLVGSGPSRASLMALAGARGQVHFHGFLGPGELEALRQRCEVFALLPMDEPFGMVFPENAARGLLLVGPDHGGPLEILDHGRLGWISEAFSPSSFRDALEAICATGDGEIRTRREEADLACRARFGADVVGPALLRILEA
jgi:glycosyltransferase involved in cell wall biosynthesis